MNSLDIQEELGKNLIKIDNLLKTADDKTLLEGLIDFIKHYPKAGMSIEDVSKGFIPKITDDLLQEARKYKSAEEFVKGQGKPVYHGSSEVISGEFRNPLYLSENKAYADTYQHTGASSMGRVKKGGGEKTYEFYKAPKERILDVRNPKHI